MRIVLLGAPGSGKGTQAQKMMAERGIPQISTGDLLRAAVAAGSDLGLQAKAAMDAGELVSDDIVLGFPRNESQAESLGQLLDSMSIPLDCAVLMNVDTDILMKRLTGRRTCSATGKVLNIYFSPKEDIDACVEAGGELLRRDDDNEDTIANRLGVYRRQTEPLIDYYRSRGKLITVDAVGSVDEVYQRLLAAI